MIMSINKTKEFRQGLLDLPSIQAAFMSDLGCSYVHHRINPLIIGTPFLLKVNTSVGIDHPTDLDSELVKIDTIMSSGYPPDLVMDHTRKMGLRKPIWRYLTEMTDIPVGTVPVYSEASKVNGIDRAALLETIEEMGSAGVTLMTFHPTAMRDLMELAKSTRALVMTSRGGGDVLRDAEINKRDCNVIADSYLDILKILKQYDITLSIGSVFRPGQIDDALDAVHLRETEEQGKFIEIAKQYGVHVIMEGIGHISLSNIAKYCDLIKPFKTPLMPLGPMPTDASIGWDHVTSAVGAAFASAVGNVGIINGVTQEEHTGGVPSTASVMDGLKCAIAVAHMINLERFPAVRNIDRAVSDYRAQVRSCRANGGLFQDYANIENEDGCDRCGDQCPLAYGSVAQNAVMGMTCTVPRGIQSDQGRE